MKNELLTAQNILILQISLALSNATYTCVSAYFFSIYRRIWKNGGPQQIQ